MRRNHCDPERLDSFLNNRLSGLLQEDVESHLMHCGQCRSTLDNLAGGKRWWDEVHRYLSPGHDAPAAQTSDPDGPASNSAIDLDFLKPSENATSLGRLGGWEILDVLGQGGMGIVLKALDPALNRIVAIKVLAAEHAARGPARKRFVREAQAAAAVVHDHVVQVHAVDPDATPPYLVMAFVAGQSLQQRIDRTGPLETKEILRIGSQTAAGLAAAHAQGLVHRDIKPANIMLENGIERVRITDFGLARAIDDASVTQNGMVAGTPQYMAPEQARGEIVDQRADLFALGSVMYTMATARAPFQGDCGLTVIRQVCDVEPTPIRAINPDVPAWLEGIVRKLHEKEPEQRFQSASEVAQLLESCLAHVQDPRSHRLPVAAQVLGKEVDRDASPGFGRTGWIAAALLLLSIGAGTWYAVKHWAGAHTISRETDASAAVRLEPAEFMSLEPDFQRTSTAARNRLWTLQGSLEPMQQTGNQWDFAVNVARRRLHAFRAEMTSPTMLQGDPVSAELNQMRRRLESIRSQEGF